MIFAFFNIILFSSSISCLRWAPFSVGNTLESPVKLSGTVGTFSVNVYKGDQIIIYRDISKESMEFEIFCLVSGVSPKSSMVYKFCQDNDCNVWKELDFGSVLKRSPFTISRMPNANKGLALRVILDRGGTGFSTTFKCHAEDTVGKFTITSNDIQIRDTYEWSKYYVTNNENAIKTDVLPVKRDTLPITFKCAQGLLASNLSRPIWFDQLAVSPVEWSVCPVLNNYGSLTARQKATFSNCVKYTTEQAKDLANEIKPIGLESMTNWNHFVDTNGDLQIFMIDTDAAPPSVTYALMCYRRVDKAVPISTYVNKIASGDNKDDILSGVEFIGAPATFPNKLEPISPLVQHVNLYQRTLLGSETLLKPVLLFAMYRASSDAKAVWFFNGQKILESTYLKVNDYAVKFLGEISSKDAGIYTLLITDGPGQLTMTINVTVLGSPILDKSDCLPLVAYVHESQSKLFTCTFRSSPTDLMLQINSVKITLGETLDTSRINLGKTYPFLGELNFTISPSGGYTTSEVVTMTYSVINLRKTLGQTVYQDHNVMFLAENRYGSISRSSSIYVVPNLKENILSSPEAYNCTDNCNSDMEHRFQCKINIENYENRELMIEHYWTINSNVLGAINGSKNLFTNFFTVDPITKELVMHPIKSNNSKENEDVKAALKENNIECHFNLYSPGEVTPRFVYLSTSDASLGTMMKARIRLDYLPINTAYIYWIVAVILALIIILLMIILLTRYCMRNKGETYQLDKIERKHGYDPEKEVQEEMFKPYEREEHDLDVMSGDTGDRKLSITGHSVGSADDGELDTYDLDPSNFNEDGSIIGKYGANPRSRAAMT